MTLAQTDFCKKHEYDPEDPLCAHIILTGKLVRVTICRARERHTLINKAIRVQVTDPKEKSFARKALFSRHPEMHDWPKG